MATGGGYSELRNMTPKMIRAEVSSIAEIILDRYLIIGSIELTDLRNLGAAIFDCVIRSCDMFDWFIRACYGPTVILAVFMSLELFCVSNTR